MTSTLISVQSPAKINWNLRVLGRREDGFHAIESLMSAITLFDELTFETRPEVGVQLLCNNPKLPTDHSNLVVRAAELLAERADHSPGLSCRLTKRIPIGGGLGGGSSNAASTLQALNELWALNQPADDLLNLAAELGSDVSFFLHGRSAVISGRGEQVKLVELGWRGWIVLILPGIAVSTAEVYRAWQADKKQAAEETIVPQADNAREWMEYMFNMLERPAFKICPQLGELKEKVERLADRPIRLSGSGSTMFTAFDDQKEAKRFAEIIDSRLNVETCVVQPVEHT